MSRDVKPPLRATKGKHHASSTGEAKGKKREIADSLSLRTSCDILAHAHARHVGAHAYTTTETATLADKYTQLSHCNAEGEEEERERERQ